MKMLAHPLRPAALNVSRGRAMFSVPEPLAGRVRSGSPARRGGSQDPMTTLGGPKQ